MTVHAPITPTKPVRTRIAPSPTGFLHLGTARTALYAWAFARHHGGQFVLRIEDTDVARSTQASVDQIIASLAWLGLDHDEGPFFQMQRLDRYREVANALVARGLAYPCYCTPQELDALREAQRERGEKTHYDRRWRPEAGKTLPPVPEGVAPVLRFCNPIEGPVTWVDLVKGPITIDNRELDDLILIRADGVPTYNFAVVVDDMDMRISHVFRGDEHINNTPWQINLYRALGAELPEFGHFPIILGDDGQKLSKRRGAVSVMAYEEAGYLPQGMLNYLARLGWSHGDDELFTPEQITTWFDGSHLSKSPAQWDAAKLAWVNAHHLKQLPLGELAVFLAQQMKRRLDRLPEHTVQEALDKGRLEAMAALFRDRCNTVVELLDWVRMYFEDVAPTADDLAAHVPDTLRPALAQLRETLTTASWDKAGINDAIKLVLKTHQLKMPQLAHAVRVLVCGRAQTPSLDAVLALFDQEKVLKRLQAS